MNFSLKKSAIFTALRWEGFFRGVKTITKILGSAFLVLIALFVFSFFYEPFSQIKNPGFIVLSLFIVGKILGSFFELKLKNPNSKDLNQTINDLKETNLADFLGFETAKAVQTCFDFSKEQNPSSTSLLYYLLEQNHCLDFIFNRALLNIKEIKKKFKEHIKEDKSNDFERIILDSIKIAQQKRHLFVEKGDFLIALCKQNTIFKKIMIDNDLYIQDIQNLIWWLEDLERRRDEKKRFWDYKNLVKSTADSIGKNWATAYTVVLDKYSSDWTENIKRALDKKVIGRDKEIRKIENILSGKEANNVLLVGEPGSGRKTIVYAFTKKILFGQSLPELNYKRVVELDVAGLAAQAKDQEKTNFLLETIFQEVIRAKNIILLINNLHQFLPGPERKESINIFAPLAKYLRSPYFRVIGICDNAGFRQKVETNSFLMSNSEKLPIAELPQKEVILVLENLVPFYETSYKSIVSYPALRSIVDYSDKYLPDTTFPKKAIKLLETVVLYVSTYKKKKIVDAKDVAEVVTEKTKIPVGELETKEKTILLNLEKLIHQRIINQDKAVNEIAEALRRARSQITAKEGPIGTFLFLGPTGVGKTETSKALAEIYFGHEKRMIRLDMSEFQRREDIPRLIGHRYQKGLLTTAIREKPFSLILLDEVEKAHSEILNLFLQVLDEGHLTDGFGRKVDFKNAIIIATSNAGYKIILKALEEKTEWSGVKKKLLDYVFKKAIFRPEFINRFDAMVVFQPLTQDNLLDIAELILKKLNKNLAQKYIELEITNELKQKIVMLGYNSTFGAREIKRVIQDKVENTLAQAFLSGEIKKGDKIKLTEEFNIIKTK